MSIRRRSRGRLITVPLVIVGALTLSAPAAGAASLDPALTRLAKAQPTRSVDVIAQFKSGTSARSQRAIVRFHHGRVTKRLPAVHGLAVKLKARDAVKLGRSKRVRKVTLDAPMRSTSLPPDAGRLATTYPKTVGADKLWAAGITGKGIGVAIIDSGISGDKPDFKDGDGGSRVAANVVVSSAATRSGDDVGHGTHVSGIVAGNSLHRAVGDPSYGAYVGIAPDADLIMLKVADDAGEATMIDVITALQYAVDHKDELGIGVLNLSMSSDTAGASYLDDPINAAVEYAWHSGIVVVVAAGNRGTAADAVQYPPGNDPYAISVGATDELGTANPADDVTAAYSSRGITQDGVAKPDVLAPGEHIVAPLAVGSAFATLCPACVVAGQYLRIGGTSMAAPVVAGGAALLLQARPDLNPDQIKGLLTGETGVARTGLGLGTAESFAVLAGTTVTNTGPSTLAGNLGLSPGTAVTGFGPGTAGTAYTADAIALKAQADLALAYDDAGTRGPARPAPADLAGLTLTPGVYANASSLGLTGTLTLDAQGDPNAVFVLRAGSTLTTAAGSVVNLVNGAQACNVFWRVGSSATLGTSSVLGGTILAATSISMASGVTLHGRAFARSGAVTLIDDTITAARCAPDAGGSATAGELDLGAALIADPGVGANQHLWPNHDVEAALVRARLDPTRADWTKGTWSKGSWTKGTWSKGTWSKGTWSGD